MKTFLILFCCLVGVEMMAQGKFASPSLKSIIGKTCKNENEFPELKGFTALGGTLLTDVNDPEPKLVSLFSKGTTIVVLFEALVTENQFSIIDVIEIKNIQRNQELKVGECRDGLSENPKILALTERSKEDRWKAVKAWYINVDKIRIEEFPPKNVTCFGIVGED
ncbi:hypothetical protein BH10BAC4_BH10BAC4_07680 [soil metagenome]